MIFFILWKQDFKIWVTLFALEPLSPYPEVPGSVLKILMKYFFLSGSHVHVQSAFHLAQSNLKKCSKVWGKFWLGPDPPLFLYILNLHLYMCVYVIVCYIYLWFLFWALREVTLVNLHTQQYVRETLGLCRFLQTRLTCFRGVHIFIFLYTTLAVLNSGFLQSLALLWQVLLLQLGTSPGNWLWVGATEPVLKAGVQPCDRGVIIIKNSVSSAHVQNSFPNSCTDLDLKQRMQVNVRHAREPWHVIAQPSQQQFCG